MGENGGKQMEADEALIGVRVWALLQEIAVLLGEVYELAYHVGNAQERVTLPSGVRFEV